MQTPASGCSSTRLLSVLLVLGLTACGETSTQFSEHASSANAKPGGGGGGGGGGSTVTVTSADPSYGHQGDNQKLVKITGTGFSAGAVASWELNGAPASKIAVLSTQFVSSTEVDATINIAPDADLTFYNVAVTTTNGKKGIGTELFEVTTAQFIAGGAAGLARDANDNGQMVGRAPTYFWDINTGRLETLDPSAGSAWGLSDDGQTVAGGVGDGSPSGTTATVWTRTGSGWSGVALPLSAGSAGASHARGVTSDPFTGAAVAIVGVENPVSKGNKVGKEPRLWTAGAAGWQVHVLPGTAGTTTGQANDATASLTVVGNTSGGATVWSPNGSGGWTAALIGGTGSDALAINTAGDFVVGTNGTAAVYWQRSGSSWSGPITLPGACLQATGVDDFGRIVADVCSIPGANSPNSLTSIVITAPYGAADLRYLRGFGSRTDGPQVEAISRQGHYIVGRATLANGTVVGAFWALY